MALQEADQLLRTKLRRPSIRSNLVARPRLRAQIEHGLCGPLTLITAPAGFGKTTLVASCVASCGMPVAWLSLDKNDNQAGRFLTYLVSALAMADDTLGSEARQLLAASPPAPAEAVLTSLINDLDSIERHLVLVLDDYQFINSQAVHEPVTFLLEHCPQTFHLLIATRSDPSLPLARFRARGQIVELRAADLRFTSPEIGEFLGDVMGLRLDAGSVAVLEERTEGWIAGLQMAAVSLRDHKDVHGFIEGFSGTHRYILDYLLEEVLIAQTPEVQQFLLCTSILERLSAPLCDALLAEPEVAQLLRRSQSVDLPANPSTSQRMLEELERANLFLVPLDDERNWYRYHHLFGDLLRARLDQLYSGLSRRLHTLAADWLEQAGMAREAISHALAAGAHEQAARLVEENTARLFAQGELNTLMTWVEALPAQLRRTRPWLCVHQACALAFAGQPAEMEPLLSQAERTAALSADVAGARALKGAVAAVRAVAAVLVGQDDAAVSQALRARELLPADDLFDQYLAAWALGNSMLTYGRLTDARLAFEEHIRLGRAMDDIMTIVVGLTYQAEVLRAQGQLRQARAHLEEALAEASRHGARSLGYIALQESDLAAVLAEQNELEPARALVEAALAHIRRWPNPNYEAYAYTIQARVLLAQADLHGARAAITEADRIGRIAPLTRLLRRAVETELVRVWLALRASGVSVAPGDPLAEQCSALSVAWRSELAAASQGDAEQMDESAENAAFNLARLSLSAGDVEEAISLLERVIRSAKAAGHTNRMISSLVLSAVASQKNEGSSRSRSRFEALEEALRLGESGGYVRTFLDEGKPMQMLLSQWLARASTSSVRKYAIYLMSQFDAELKIPMRAQRNASSAAGLVEPISERELEVLQLMAGGMTNREIAQQLIVAPGTVKAHAASIYRKLDAANRTEAVARARQLGIIR